MINTHFFADFSIMGLKDYFINPIFNEMQTIMAFANSNNANNLVASLPMPTPKDI
jgi:hypothetical protein